MRNENLIECAIEVLEKLNLSGDTSYMDNELKADIVESFERTGYIKFLELNKRPVVAYESEKEALYLYADSFKELSDEDIKTLKNSESDQ